jgi:hypothetical protein
MSVLKTITLDTPITRGSSTITEVSLRKPTAGELRGVSLASLMQMDVTELTKVLPRITQPTLTDAELAQLDIADLTQFATEVTGFLLPKALQGSLSV